ncbi:Cobalt-zinc-cadmium resistance protein [Candidatus Hydrogenisulfobacillus filiaventi]|uniref:Cobalt-zinc-cadmium resistance protein n=1 Tax=Candidatus Hydrogenisulfobacillus filiaventi TaxID=2707344 RepID=A0A6F8ZGI6_9FIRM|nr:cation diffusion facilitator family transporter [Bacillota bacterium]CAB1128817.1 Cobalt-zinc-cadmium resistance protein [Candidatus Hydrogenisulfobacillus filiaventi]
MRGADRRQRRKSGWMLASALFNGVLAAAKVGWGLYSGSTVVLADAVHSVSDVLGALLILAAIRFAPHRSPRFPYGLFKVEDLAALGGAELVLVAVYEIVAGVFLAGGAQAPRNPVATLLFIGAVLVAEGVFFAFERRAAIRLASPGLQSDVANWLGDLGAGLVVMAGIGGHLLRIPYAQDVAVVIIVVLILLGTWGVVKGAVLSLLDASVDPDLYARAQAILAATPEVDAVKELRLRRAGSVLFADATIAVSEASFHRAHDVASHAEERLRAGFPQLETVTIHYEPPARPFRRRAYLLAPDRGLSPHFGAAPLIRFEDEDPAGGPVTARVLANPMLKAERGTGIRLAAWLIAQGVEEIHLGPGRMEPALEALLNAAGVSVVVEGGHPRPSTGGPSGPGG